MTATAHAAEGGTSKASVKYVRFRKGDTIAYGIVEGDRVRQLQGDLFGNWSKTETLYPIKDVELLVPCTPKQVIAMAGNYKSHLKDAGTPAKFKIPQPFFKSIGSLQRHEGPIVLPGDAHVVHYEAELVIVIGKQASRVSKEKALDYVLGVTCGNDVSERYWQGNEADKDVQWWRAKGSDTFGPCGPFIVSGLNYDDLQLTLRLNGEVKQQERTSLFIHDVPTMISFVSQYLTLYPGDLIFTGTPGQTSAIKPGDVVEVELEGVGVLRNKVVAQE